MADKAETPNKSVLDEAGASPDPQYIADREHDIRMFCVRAAIDLNRPGESSARSILSEAKEILDFLHGSAQ